MAIMSVQSSIGSRPSAPLSLTSPTRTYMLSRPTVVNIRNSIVARNPNANINFKAISIPSMMQVQDNRVIGQSGAMQQNDRFIKWN